MRWCGNLALAGLVAAAAMPTAEAATFRPIGVTNGLGAKVVPGVMVDRDGFLWAASREGLYRYDGYRALHFEPNAEDPHSITDTDLRALYQDPEGVIWVATNTGGLNRLDPRVGGFDHFRHDSADPTTLSDDSVYGMAQGPDGHLWVGTQIGLNRFNRSTGEFTRFLHDPVDPNSLSNDYVFTVFLDGFEALWIATVGGGLNRWLPENETFDHYDLERLAGGPPGLNDVFALVEDRQGVLWVGTRSGLVRLDRSLGTADLRPLVDGPGDQPLITSMSLAEDGTIWIGTLAHGLIRFDPVAESVLDIPDTGLSPAVPIMCLETVGDALVVGTWGEGVFFSADPGAGFDFIGGEEAGGVLRYRNVTAVMATDEPGRPWVGTFGGGPQWVDVQAGTAETLIGEPDELASAGVLAFARTTDGGLFVGTAEGLWKIVDEEPQFRSYRQSPDRPGHLGEGYIPSLLAVPRGLWVGVGGSGLYFLENGSSEFRAYRHESGSETSLSGDYITALLEGGVGSIWVGTRSNGLNLCRVEPWSCRRFPSEPGVDGGIRHHFVTDLYRDSRGREWVGTAGGGLYLVTYGEDGDVLGFRRWGVSEGLLSLNVMSMVEDDDGSLWVTTREGMTRFDPEDPEISRSFPVTSLPVESFTGEAADRDAEFLYFGAVNGLLVIPAGTPFEPGQPAPVRFTSAEVTGDREGLENRPITGNGRLSLDWGDILEVGFAVLDFAETPHRYEYRLRATDPWIDLGFRRELVFAGLSPGVHLLQVRGRGVNGLWSEAPSLALEVVPPFWMTSWFRLAALAGLVLVALTVHRRRMSVLERRNLELTRLKDQREVALAEVSRSEAELKEAYQGLSRLAQRLETAEEEERRRISHELHDELGQTLTAAKISLQLASRSIAGGADEGRLDDAIDMVDDMIGQVRSIALRLRPPLLDEAGLVPSLDLHLQEIATTTGVPIELEARGDLSDLSPDSELVLFRVVQEAVGNSLRHAGPNRITVEVVAAADRVAVTVSDDGCGFDVAEVRRRAGRGDHLGLLGIRERLRGVGGALELDSQPGHGTRVRVTVPR